MLPDDLDSRFLIRSTQVVTVMHWYLMLDDTVVTIEDMRSQLFLAVL